MSHDKYQSCISACEACADACDHCASACLDEKDASAMARCIRLDMDCAQLCRLAAGYMARGSEHAKAICELCADICEACAEECVQHEHEHCQECADACRRCAQECRQMSGNSQGSGQKQVPAGQAAH